jgi:hypothetical protein
MTFRNEKSSHETDNINFEVTETPVISEIPEVFIEQNGRNINEITGFYTIEDQKFNILIRNADNKTIHIFAYHSGEMFKKYVYPVKCENTVIFHPATALITGADENKEITLTINREMQYNVITTEKRIDNNGTALIKIKDIADTDDKFNGMLYLTIYIDFNKNGIIEENEIKNIILRINKSADTVLFKAKIYISTIGSRIINIDNHVYSNEYFYIKITNETEKQQYIQLFGQNNAVNTFSTINRIINLDYTRRNIYVVFSPLTAEIEFYNNPYHYKGDNRLIFETRINRESDRGTYVSCREYQVEKTRDIFEMWVNDNGELRMIKKMDLYGI